MLQRPRSRQNLRCIVTTASGKARLDSSKGGLQQDKEEQGKKVQSGI